MDAAGLSGEEAMRSHYLSGPGILPYGSETEARNMKYKISKINNGKL